MAIRLRTVSDVRIALCAAETDPAPGDVYLDDADHYALAAKFRLDWKDEQTTGWPDYPTEWAIMATQKLRDAKEELLKTLDTFSTAPVNAEVKVRLLEWYPSALGGKLAGEWFFADSMGMRYTVHLHRLGKWRLSLKATPEAFAQDIADFDTLDAAKAAAQTDYEARIRSALAPPPVEPVQGVTEAPEGWVLVPEEPTSAMLVAVTGISVSGPYLGENDAHDIWDAMLAALAAAPEGMVLVPKDPTEAMLEAARYARQSDPSIMADVNSKTTYHAMLAAALATAGGAK